jgi:hypothetical protein
MMDVDVRDGECRCNAQLRYLASWLVQVGLVGMSSVVGGMSFRLWANGDKHFPLSAPAALLWNSHH